MDFAHDSTSRLSAKDEMMMGTPHASPAKPQKVRKGHLLTWVVNHEVLNVALVPTH